MWLKKRKTAALKVNVIYERSQTSSYARCESKRTLLQKALVPSAEVDNVEHQSVGPEMIDTALRVCQEFLSVLKHGDIDADVKTPPLMEERRWAEFLQDYYMVMQ